jgi:cystathionine beta-lyase
LLAVSKTGDHLLVCDNVYRLTRRFCDGLLARYGVETTYFDPLIGEQIGPLFTPKTCSRPRPVHAQDLFTPKTCAVLVEAPGSQSFEMPDLPPLPRPRTARSSSTTTLD